MARISSTPQTASGYLWPGPPPLLVIPVNYSVSVDDSFLQLVAVDVLVESRFALGTLALAAVLPTLDADEDGTRKKSTRSKLIYTLLIASEQLSTREVVSRADILREPIPDYQMVIE